MFIRVSCTAFTVFFFQVEKEQEKKEESYKQKIKVNLHYIKIKLSDKISEAL